MPADPSSQEGPPAPETFDEFRRSFSYGQRTDLNFKFLKNLSEADAAQFFQELLHSVGDTADDGNADRLTNLVLAWQQRAYAGPSTWTYDDGPFTALAQPVAQSRLTLLSSSGHFVQGQDPQPFGVPAMTQEEAIDRINDFLKEEPTMSAIPFGTPADQLVVRHGGYDIRSAQADPNVTLPLALLSSAQADGAIGSLTDNAYSFMGACAQTRLLRRTGPKWAEELVQQGVDGAVLVPV